MIMDAGMLPKNPSVFTKIEQEELRAKEKDQGKVSFFDRLVNLRRIEFRREEKGEK